MAKVSRDLQFVIPFESGFTLIEILAVIVMVGILAAIAAPSYLGFVVRQRLSTAQAQIYQNLQLTQSKAQSTSKDWRFAVQQQGDNPVEWAIYPRYDVSGNPIDPTDSADQVNWEAFDPNILLSMSSGSSQSGVNGTYYSAIYDYKGNANKRLTFTVVSPNDDQLKRCVIMSTILGAVKMEKDDGCP